MPYWGSRGEIADDFDNCDPTAYSGGYDISLTYGRPLEPSDDICYPLSGTGGADSEIPHYSSGLSQTSAYEVGNIRKGDCYGLLRPSQQPSHSLPPQPQPETDAGYPDYGYKRYGSEGIGGAGYTGVSDYKSGHGQPPQPHQYGSNDFGSGFYGRPQRQGQGGEYGSVHLSGYSPHEGSFGFGSGGYPRNDEEGYGRQGYGGSEYRRTEEEAAGGYRRHGDHPYEGNLSYERPNYNVAQEQSGGPWNLGYSQGGSGTYKKSGYDDEEQRTGYLKPSYYGGREGEEYGSSKYGNDSDDDEKKQRYPRHHHHHHYDH